MINTNRYLAMGMFGLAIIGAGCATRDVDVRSPIQAESRVEGDSSTARGRGSSASTGAQTDRSSTTSSSTERSGSGSATGSASGSGSISR